MDGHLIFNRVSELPKSETVPAVVSVVNNNPNVVGLDLHVHALKINQAEDDFRIIRDKYGVTKKLICTEFSMVRALNPHVADALGEWGTKHGYTAGMKIYEYLNLIAEKANAGTPVRIGIKLFMRCSRNMIRMPLPDVLVWFPVERELFTMRRLKCGNLEEFIFPVI